jgi:peptidoglycan/LPS O-acetylase OafA/YrhL
VFLHHSYIWQQYLQTKKWEEPRSNLFNHFGQTSVVMFFIITAFLFITKVLESKNDFDWNHYLKSRFFRLFPMYFFMIIIVFLLLDYYTHFELKDSFLNNLKSTLSWLVFSINGTTDINGFKDTFLMNSGVSWTLPYEWMFYFLLPIFGLLLKKNVKPRIVLFFTLTFLLILFINKSSIRHFMPFIGGILAALLFKKMNLKYLEKSLFSILIIVLIVYSVCFFESGRKPIPILLSSIIFIIIASGNSIFGVLTNSISRKFGQITYSLYLVHGTLLFVVFYAIIGVENATKLSNAEYWGIIALTVIPLIFISQLTFKYIELPMMQFLKNKKT